MNEWMETFIAQCLADIPWGKYRQRAEKELRDHMETQYQVLTEAGASPSEARSRVLEAMGDPERLRKEYHVAWKQAPLSRVNWLASGVIVIWILMFVCDELLEGIDITRTQALAVLFLIPFSLGTLLLRACFREERRRAWWVTLGLLAAWVTFNSYMVFWAVALEAFDKYPEHLRGRSPLAATLERNPWMMPYLCLTFAGCLALGWLSGRKKKGSLA